jgi:biotin---protein ligase
VDSVKQCEFTFRQLLYPTYAVIRVGEKVIKEQPWEPTCALLVVPGGADLGYCKALNGPGNWRITQYVRNGGKYLGFCAGGYYASQKCEFEVGNKSLEVVGTRELAFFPGTCRGGAFSGFDYSSENGTRAAKLAVRTFAFPENSLPENEEPSWLVHCYYNGGGVFVDAGDISSETQVHGDSNGGQGVNSVEVLATYEDPLDVDGGSDNGRPGKAAMVYCRVGSGAALLSGPHPELVAPVAPAFLCLLTTE